LLVSIDHIFDGNTIVRKLAKHTKQNGFPNTFKEFILKGLTYCYYIFNIDIFQGTSREKFDIPWFVGDGESTEIADNTSY